LKILREAKPDTWIVFSTDEDRLVAAEAARKAEEAGEKDPILSEYPAKLGTHSLIKTLSA